MSRAIPAEVRIRSNASALDAAFQSGDYFRVIVLAPQLMVEIADVLANYTDVYLRGKGFLDPSPDEKTMREVMNRLQRTESDRAQIAATLASIFECESDTIPTALKNFMSAFTKLEALVSMRNRLAHEYYKVATTPRSLTQQSVI